MMNEPGKRAAQGFPQTQTIPCAALPCAVAETKAIVKAVVARPIEAKC